MNARQRKFCDEYLVDLNASQAAIRAGYAANSSRVTGAKLLAKPNIRTYIDAELERLHNERVADVQEVMEYLTAVMRGETTEQTTRLIGEGVQEITDIQVPAKQRVKAAELLGKRYGLFIDKTDLSITAPVVISGESDLVDDYPADQTKAGTGEDVFIQHSKYQKE